MRSISFLTSRPFTIQKANRQLCPYNMLFDIIGDLVPAALLAQDLDLGLGKLPGPRTQHNPQFTRSRVQGLCLLWRTISQVAQSLKLCCVWFVPELPQSHF